MPEQKSTSAEECAKEAGFVETGRGIDDEGREFVSYAKPSNIEFVEKYGESHQHNAPNCQQKWIQKGKVKFCPGCGEQLGSSGFAVAQV